MARASVAQRAGTKSHLGRKCLNLAPTAGMNFEQAGHFSIIQMVLKHLKNVPIAAL